MHNLQKFYIDGQWVEPQGEQVLDVLNPATDAVVSQIRLGNESDVERAVAAAVKAFPAFSQSSKEERIALLERVVECYNARLEDLAQATTEEMGAPIEFSRNLQVMAGLSHIKVALSLLKKTDFSEQIGTTTVVKEPVGVCAMITPWNWPLNQITCKVAPALAAGCTMVLKPSEVAPRTAHIFAEILHEAGVPAGVFNLVDGDGPTVGAALSAHPQIDMVSFTGSTQAGKQVSIAAAENLKKVSLELGGKSANIILDDADFAKVVRRSVKEMMANTGQSCNARSRMLVPESRLAETIEIAKAAAESVVTGDPSSTATAMGPVVSALQWQRVQALIQTGIDEGAELVAGGTGLPDGLESGCYVKPTVFAGVTPEMTIAREEIFGPVLSIMTYKDEEDAIAIANDSIYGLSGAVFSADLERAKAVAGRIRTGMIHLNGASTDARAPFGGYKQSGVGREWGHYGLEEFLETKAMFGAVPRD
ncbi:aldehyde dehydrogenase family protein [Neptuniibacter halophilus]|uniref:aldehyde dehydrogenase family protein n=1 Tax=Neptuniibacter halophilus TaxID=651666 RepID=UPI00257486F6|nr:aldehyde dehydrogenase family protein [Neptuniibacter halophilus]